MNFSTPQKVYSVINSTEEVERRRAENRDRISKGINGFPPLSDAEAKQMGLKININWLEEAVLFKQAVLQFHNAFQTQNHFFNIRVPSAPQQHQLAWEQNISRFINEPLKKSRVFAGLMDQQFSSVVAHGIAPVIWPYEDAWLPRFTPLDDFRVPTDTLTDLSNLSWFGIRRRYTIGELAEAVFGKNADAGWNREIVIKILAAYWNKNWETVDCDWASNPEKMTHLIKQNLSYYVSDAVPVITLWHLYHVEDETSLKKRWLMKVIPDKLCRGFSGSDDMSFVFDDDNPVADGLDSLLHVHFGDLNGTPPFLYHSVRSLGLLLNESCFWMNLFRCRTFQSAWEQYNLLWSSADGSPKARAQFLEFFHKGYVPNNVTILDQSKKNQINQPLVEFVMAQARQLMGEAGSSYTQAVDTGTARLQTLGEAQIKLQQANSMMSGILAVASRNQSFFYKEIARRFCIKKSIDPDVRKFQRKCNEAGVPVEFMDETLWEIIPDMPLGAGSQTIEIAQAQQLMSVRQMHGPEAQQEILHIYDSAITKNPRLAQRLAPVGQQQPLTNGQQWAASIFGTLMTGAPAPQRMELNPVDQIQLLLEMSAQVVSRIMRTDNMGTPEDVAGLNNVFSYVSQMLQQLAQDKAQVSVVKNFNDALSKLANVVRAFAQRQEQKSKAEKSVRDSITIDFKDLYPDTQNAVLASIGIPPSRMPPRPDPKLVGQVLNARINGQKSQQELQHDEARFQMEQQHEAARSKIKLTSEMAKIFLDHAKGNQELARENAAQQGFEV